MMNWEIFSNEGYISIALWLSIPLLWLIYLLWRRRFICRLLLMLAIAAFVLARINSYSYVNRIQIDRSREIAEQLARQEAQKERAKQAATESRENEVAQIHFAEDDADDFLDTAGMDEADLKYMQSFDDDTIPEWKKEKKERSSGTEDNSIESKIGATDQSEGINADVLIEEEPAEPILMADKDKLMADRLDAANLMITRIFLGLAILLIIYDYLRRANIYKQATFPLPLPSSWIDSFTPMPSVRVLPKKRRRKLLRELKVLIKRGDSFIYLTDNTETAYRVPARAYRLPLCNWPADIIHTTDDNNGMDEDFIFETLWYGRNSFVVNSVDRSERILQRFIELLAERRSTRARVRQTVHVVWDIATPISEEMRYRFANLGRDTGYSLLLCREAD